MCKCSKERIGRTSEQWKREKTYLSLTVFITFAYWETEAGSSGSMVIFSFLSIPNAVSNFFSTSKKIFFNISFWLKQKEFVSKHLTRSSINENQTVNNYLLATDNRSINMTKTFHPILFPHMQQNIKLIENQITALDIQETYKLRRRFVWWKVNHFPGILIGWNHFQVFGTLFIMENNFLWELLFPYLGGITFLKRRVRIWLSTHLGKS